MWVIVYIYMYKECEPVLKTVTLRSILYDDYTRLLDTNVYTYYSFYFLYQLK